jgi:hypothetical protein
VAASVAIPITALSRTLAAVDIAPHQFEGRAPTYRCPACNEPFQPDAARCRSCGRLLPHAFGVRDPSGRTAPAERVVHEWATELGPGAGIQRVAPRVFRLTVPLDSGGRSDVLVDVDAEGTTLRAKLPVAPVPLANVEPFYRFLLTFNDQAAGSQRFSVEEDTVFLSVAEPVALLRAGEGARLLHDLTREAERFTRTLRESFDAGQDGLGVAAESGPK